MADNKELQAKSLESALKKHTDAPANGELPDDALDGVSGGAVLDASFYIAKCKKCGWQSRPFDGAGVYDLDIIVLDHLNFSSACKPEFEVYGFNSRTVQIG